jgi:hypothetical protein
MSVGKRATRIILIADFGLRIDEVGYDDIVRGPVDALAES